VTSRRHMGWVAGAATMLAAAPLSVIFETWTWFGQCLLLVGLIAGVATLTRWLRGPLWAQGLAMAGTLLLLLTWFYPSGEEFLGIIPSPGTLGSFGDLLGAAVNDMRSYGVPVPDRRGLLFLTALGVGGVAVLVDLFTVGLRRPALAGLPMLAIYSVPVAVLPDSVPAVPFVIGAAGFLWLLVADNVDRVRRFGRRFTGDGRDVDVWEPSPLAAAGRRLALVGVVVAVLLPLAVPGMGSGLLDRFGTGPGDGPGRGTRQGVGSVDLFAVLSGKLFQSKIDEMLKVTTDEPDPFYLRFATADQITGLGVGNRPPNGRSISRGLPDPHRNDRSGIKQQTYHARVEVTGAFDMPMLPIYLDPASTDGLDSSWLYDPEARVLYSNRSRSAKRTYEFEYVRTKYSDNALRSARSLGNNDPVRRAFTDVPEIRDVTELVARLTRGKDNDYDKVRAIYDYFSIDNGFTYSLETEKGNNGAAIVDFLTKKKGYCQQYAAALTWLVRAAGIPARVAFGFSNGSQRRDRTYTLTNKNLHAWTEVFFDGFGWIPFDATPKSGVAGSVRTDWAPDVDQPATTNPEPELTDGPGSSGGPGGSAAPDPRLAGDNDFGGPLTTPNESRWPLWTLGGVALALALLAVPMLRRSLLRRRRQARGRGSDAVTVAALDEAPPGEFRVISSDVREAERARAHAHAAWDELLDTLVDFRVVVDPAETPRATAERLSHGVGLPEPAVDGARLLSRAEERARYARDPLQVAQFGPALRGVRRALKDQVSRRTRITAALMPPSVLLRWRLGLVEAGTRTMLLASRVREALLRLSPRRLIANRAKA
jgi:transglutaminase-like putative cysteine protease